MVLQELKAELARELSSFKEIITIKSSNPEKLIAETLNENPRVAFYLKSYQSVSTSFSPLSGIKVRFSYCNKDIPENRVYIVKNENELYDILHKSIANIEEKIGVVSENFTVDRGIDNFSAIYGLFYSNLTNISYSYLKFDFLKYTSYILDFSYRIERVKLISMKKEVEDKIKELDKKLFHPAMTNLEVAYVAHNYLAKTIEYWLIEDPNPLELSYRQSAYGALIKGKCVCQGYAEAYKKILDYKGIKCEVVSGKIKGENTYHAWNIISVNNFNHYHVDVTWDSLEKGKKRDDYFGLLDKDLMPTRMWTRPSGKICVSAIDITKVAKDRIEKSKDKYIKYGIDRKYLD